MEGTQMFILWKSATHTLNANIMFLKLMVAGGDGWEERILGEFGMDMYTLLYLKWRTNKDPLCSTWNSAQRYGAAWMGGESGGEWIPQLGWEGGLGENRYLCIYSWVPFLFT